MSTILAGDGTTATVGRRRGFPPKGRGAAAAVAGALLLAAAAPGPAAAGTTELISVGLGGAPGGGPFGSFDPAISADGRFVAFESGASNLVPGDTNADFDVFVRDRRAGTTERVSVRGDGGQADGGSVDARISADGRYVAFISFARNLVPGDTNFVQDVFVHDRRSRTTERVSVALGGAEFSGASFEPAISPGGRFVAFATAVSRPVSPEVFVRDRQAGRTERVNVGLDGASANGGSNTPAVSAAGRFVAFLSTATNLVPGGWGRRNALYLRDRATGRTVRVARSGSPFAIPRIAISSDGRIVAFSSAGASVVPGDTNGEEDVFVRDRRTGTPERVSVGRGGAQGDGGSSFVALAPGGRHVAFGSGASNLVPGDTNGVNDVFVRDLAARRTDRVSVAADGGQANGHSFYNAVAAGARVVAFSSEADNLVPGDTNGVEDVFVRVR